MSGANLQIGQVGKTLVHYKHYKVGAKRPPTLLSNKILLEKFLQGQHARLVSGAFAPEIASRTRKTETVHSRPQETAPMSRPPFRSFSREPAHRRNGKIRAREVR